MVYVCMYMYRFIYYSIVGKLVVKFCIIRRKIFYVWIVLGKFNCVIGILIKDIKYENKCFI